MPDGLDFGALPDWCVFTVPDVVRRALDAIGWTAGADLRDARLLEPAAGDGAFVVEAGRRLVEARRSRGQPLDWDSLKDSIVAFEVEPEIARALRSNVASALQEFDLDASLSNRLAQRWCREADFIVTDLSPDFSHAAGNPPFRRGGGSGPDACVRFIGKSFALLRNEGRMAMLAPASLGSAAGARTLRSAISASGTLEPIELFEPGEAFARQVRVAGALYVVRRNEGVHRSSGPAHDAFWLAGSPEARSVFLDAVARLPTLEEAGCRIRLGMTTGSNGIFVRRGDEFPIEPDLLVPAVATRDLVGTEVRWRGYCVPDTSRPDGMPWPVREKPRLYAYLSAHKEQLRARHTARHGRSWRQTHSRLDRALAAAPKILVAETARPCRVALDPGGHMPLNSVHAIASREWPLNALLAILSTSAVGLVAHALLLPREGGHLRMNATALRQVRIPRWSSLSDKDKAAFASGNVRDACEASARIFRMGDELLRQCAGICVE